MRREEVRMVTIDRDRVFVPPETPKYRYRGGYSVAHEACRRGFPFFLFGRCVFETPCNVRPEFWHGQSTRRFRIRDHNSHVDQPPAQEGAH